MNQSNETNHMNQRKSVVVVYAVIILAMIFTLFSSCTRLVRPPAPPRWNTSSDSPCFSCHGGGTGYPYASFEIAINTRGEAD